MAECDCGHLPGCGGPVYKWMLAEWKNCFRCENHLRLQEEWQIYSHNWYREFFGDDESQKWTKIAQLTFMDEPLSYDNWVRQFGNKQSTQETNFEYWRNTMSKYKIHQIRDDTPFVTMNGDFSMDELMNILEEMRQGYEEVREKWEKARQVPFSTWAGDISNDLLRKE